MRQSVISKMLVSSLLLFALNVAQARPQGRYQGPYGSYGGGDFRDNQRLFARVRADLDRAENNLPAFSDSRYGFDRVRGELSELQRQWDESVYEPRQVDAVIRALDRALNSYDLSRGDRDRLADDLGRLRDFRDEHER